MEATTVKRRAVTLSRSRTEEQSTALHAVPVASARFGAEHQPAPLTTARLQVAIHAAPSPIAGRAATMHRAAESNEGRPPKTRRAPELRAPTARALWKGTVRRRGTAHARPPSPGGGRRTHRRRRTPRAPIPPSAGLAWPGHLHQVMILSAPRPARALPARSPRGRMHCAIRLPCSWPGTPWPSHSATS